MPWSGMRKVQNASDTLSVVGTYSKTISKRRPAETVPLRVRHVKGDCASGLTGAQVKSYPMPVGLST